MSSRGRPRPSALQEVEEVRAWSLRDVEQALCRLGLPECADACRKRDIDGGTLLDLSESSLILWKRDLSVVNIRKLAAFIHELKNEPGKFIVNSNEVKPAPVPVSIPLQTTWSSSTQRKEESHSLKGLLPVHTKSSSSSENDAWDTDFDDEEDDDDKNRKLQVGKDFHSQPRISSNTANQKSDHFKDNNMIGEHNKTEHHSPGVTNRIPNKIRVPAAFAVHFHNSSVMTANRNTSNLDKVKQETSTNNSKPSVPIRPPGLNSRMSPRTMSNVSELPKPPSFLKDKKLTLEDIIRKIPDYQDYEDDVNYGSLDGEMLFNIKCERDATHQETEKQVADLPQWEPKRFTPEVEFVPRERSLQQAPELVVRARPFHNLKDGEGEAPQLPPLPARPPAIAHQRLLPATVQQKCDFEENYERIEYSDEEQYESIPDNGIGNAAQWNAARSVPTAVVEDSSEYYLQPVQPSAPAPAPTPTPSPSPTLSPMPPLLPPKPRALLQPPPPPPAESTVKDNPSDVPNKDNSFLQIQKKKESENNNITATDDKVMERVGLPVSRSSVALPAVQNTTVKRATSLNLASRKEKSLSAVSIHYSPSAPSTRTFTKKSPLQDVKRNNTLQVARPSPNSCEAKGGGRPLPAPPLHCDGPSQPSKATAVTRRPSIKIPLVQMPWYFNVDRKNAEEILRNAEDGTYLLRPSTQTQHPLTLTLKFGSRVFNICVRHRPDGKYALGTAKTTEQSFSSVEELVQFYMTSELLLFSNGENAGAVVLVSPPRKNNLNAFT